MALIDVGGTLWPNSWPFRETDGEGRMRRLASALPEIDPATVSALGADLIARSRPGDVARSVSTENRVSLELPAEELIAECLGRRRIAPSADVVRRIRRAMALPVHDRMRPLPGAPELLATIHSLGMRSVIASNTYWRDAEAYWEDFAVLGMADGIDAIVTSVDAGRAKPDPAVFELAMRQEGVAAARCVVIGNREDNDIEPAVALGMRSILVHPDDPKPRESRADAVAADLWECARVLRDIAG